MIPIRRLVTTVLALCVFQPTAAQQTERPTFRVSTDLVSVNVSVKAGSVPVAGLVAADFELFDNGVRQDIEAVTIEAIPIDVSLALDLSGSVTADVGKFQSEIRQLVAMLRPTDRVRLVSFADDVREVASMRSPQSPLPLDLTKPGGSTALNDGVLYSLLWTSSEPGRRHLVVVFTDGYDSRSTLDNASISALAGRVDAVLHAVLAESPVPIFARYQGSLRALREAAVKTGGEAHRLSRAVEDFKQIVDDFRASYVLRYTPKGVAREGWHALTVHVLRQGAFTVRARQGYDGG